MGGGGSKKKEKEKTTTTTTKTTPLIPFNFLLHALRKLRASGPKAAVLRF